MSMERITEVILEKVNLEAQGIIKDAEEKAYEMLDRAAKQQESRFEAAKNALLGEAEGEAARILARSSIEARQELSSAKAKVVESIVDKVKEAISSAPVGDAAFLNLIKGSLEELGGEKVIVYVAAKDVSPVTRLVESDKGLAAAVQEVKPYPCLGGVLIEDAGGKNRIDNTYDARLDKLMPQILPVINEELFKK